jgi:hypothetical protein
MEVFIHLYSREKSCHTSIQYVSLMRKLLVKRWRLKGATDAKGCFLRLEMSYCWKGIGIQVRFWDKDATQCRYKKTQTGNQDWQGDATRCQQQTSNDWSRKSCSVKLASTCISRAYILPQADNKPTALVLTRVG